MGRKYYHSKGTEPGEILKIKGKVFQKLEVTERVIKSFKSSSKRQKYNEKAGRNFEGI